MNIYNQEDHYQFRTLSHCTMYRIIIVDRLVPYSEYISSWGPLTVLYLEPLNISCQDHYHVSDHRSC